MNYHFQNACVLDVTGKHAERYANARLSNDVRLVNDSQAIEAACLTPQGRVLAFFTVLKIPDGYRLYCTGGEKDSVISAFKQFIVADQVTVADVSSQYQLWHSAPAEQLKELQLSNTFLSIKNNDLYTVINRPRCSSLGYDLLIFTNNVPSWLLDNQIDQDEFNFNRTLTKQLSFPEELDADFMFAESEMSHAVSNKKGCYAGQEAVEMLLARGQAANKVFVGTCEKIVATNKGANVFLDRDNSERAGSILSCYSSKTSQQTAAFFKVRSKYSHNTSFYIEENEFRVT